MSDIVRLPIRRAAGLQLRHEHVFDRVGGVEVLGAEIVTEAGPLTVGLFLRIEDVADKLVCTLQAVTETCDFDGFVARQALIVADTLRHAREHDAALQSEPQGPPGPHPWGPAA